MSDEPTHVLLPIHPELTDIARMARTCRAMVLGENFGLMDYAATIYAELIRPYASPPSDDQGDRRAGHAGAAGPDGSGQG